MVRTAEPFGLGARLVSTYFPELPSTLTGTLASRVHVHPAPTPPAGQA